MKNQSCHLIKLFCSYRLLYNNIFDILEVRFLFLDDPLGFYPISSSSVVQTLLSFLLPGHGRLQARIEEVLDLPLIQQQAENGALDIGHLSQFIVGMMGSFCAPCRDKDVNKLKEITEIVPLLK